RLLSSGCEAEENVRAEVEEFLRAHQTAMRKSEIEIGCLLPLSGPNAAAGERFLRGMEIALEVYSRPDPAKNTAASETRSRLPEMALLPRFKVYFYDTAGEGERARTGVDYLVHEKKVDLLLGPYTGKAANYAAAQAQSLGVTMISLSPLLRDLERYPNVFQHYPTIRNQAVSLAELARIRLGIEKFAMLVPRNRYGREFAEDFTAQVQTWGGKVVREVEYDASRPDFGPAIRELIGVRRYRRFKEQRQEYEAWLKQRQYRAAQKQAAAPAGEKPELDGANKLADLAREIGIDGAELNILDEGEIMARPLLNCDFEALVVPDREQTLKLLIPQLAFYDLDE
ncbi:MAG: ABC transporter substrate-binding protein, partial [Deltaproteobacteria bacterium]|nr:ABC transporter substrate-binding protein [Deltaproteobacteria bacterium]